MIATDRFGNQRGRCERPSVPSGPGLDCAGFYHGQLNAAPVGGARFPFAVVALVGVGLLIALLIARRTLLGTPAWTPAGPALRLAFAVPFGVVALLLLFYGTFGAFAFVQNWILSYVAAGLLAAAISVTAARRAAK
jgi:hypothetical protein